jgi:hypothetical protein
MRNVLKGLKPTCREVHRLSSEALDRELSLIERARLRLHLFVCLACSNTHAQMGLMRQAMRHLPLGDESEQEHQPKSK